MSDKKTYTVTYNDSALERIRVPDDHIVIEAEDAFEALQRTVLFQCGEDFDDIEDVRDYLIEEFDDYDDSIDWCKKYLDDVDISGDRQIIYVGNESEQIYSYI